MMTNRRAIVASFLPVLPVLILVITMHAAMVQRASAAIPVIDPSNLAINLKQALQHLEMIKRMEQQIRNQMLMLENWKATRLDDILGDMQRIQGALGGSNGSSGIANGSVGTGDINADYPFANNNTLGSVSSGQILPGELGAPGGNRMIEALRERWIQQQRQTVVAARTVQNVAYQQIRSSQSRIAQYVQESNAAPGPTAAVQVGNEIIATQIAQLQTLQALEIADANAELERQAQRQARRSQSQQIREFLFRDWLPGRVPTGSQIITDSTTSASSDIKPIRQPFEIE